MSSLTDTEKRYLEKLLGMESGYVLDYADATFGQFFRDFNVDIHGPKYQFNGSSKAKKMRAFWQVEPDEVVGPVLAELLSSYEVHCEIAEVAANTVTLEKCKQIVARISGDSAGNAKAAATEAGFLSQEFDVPDLSRLALEHQVTAILDGRLKEARTTLGSKAYLSTIFLCGSVLEGVLLGVAHNFPAKFNQCSASPKDKSGNVKPFHEWNLAQLIDVASELGLLKPDVKKFGHGLRDFRNYIHPYQQMVSGFVPDEHTAKVCFQVLKAALASLAGER
jgi:hypothetical protein